MRGQSLCRGFMIRLEEKDIGRAANTLVHSFWNDAYVRFLAADEAEREKIMPHFFEFALRYGILYGRAYAVSPNFEGAAIWLPSQYAKMTPELMDKAGAEELYSQVGEDFVARVRPVDEFVQAKHEQHISIPHWYLAFIGIDPDFQGKGFAGKLIKPMLEEFAKSGLPCYLETNTKKNVAIYEHYGFRVLEEFKVPLADLTFYAMLKN